MHSTVRSESASLDQLEDKVPPKKKRREGTVFTVTHDNLFILIFQLILRMDLHVHVQVG